jgi:hypothetical protein
MLNFDAIEAAIRKEYGTTGELVGWDRAFRFEIENATVGQLISLLFDAKIAKREAVAEHNKFSSKEFDQKEIALVAAIDQRLAEASNLMKSTLLLGTSHAG